MLLSMKHKLMNVRTQAQIINDQLEKNYICEKNCCCHSFQQKKLNRAHVNETLQ